MGQEEVYKLLKKKPRLTTREIADELSISLSHAWAILERMLDKEVKSERPTQDELQRIIQQRPHAKKGVYKLRVYFIVD